jgi:hypothetical protein
LDGVGLEQVMDFVLKNQGGVIEEPECTLNLIANEPAI